MKDNFITIISLTILIVYCIVKILNFYGVNISKYGSYLAFYFFLLITAYILPRQYPSI
jgi:branched-subunit amino acid ABC-type transport system permease component